MKTTLILMSVCLVALAVIYAILVYHYSRKIKETLSLASELELKEKVLRKRHNDLDNWEAKLKDQTRSIKVWVEKQKHIYANFEVLDSDEKKPGRRAIEKSLSSKIGYALRKDFPEIQERRDNAKGGRTIYSLDVYVMPFEAK